jgi:hypothetical protein
MAVLEYNGRQTAVTTDQLYFLYGLFYTAQNLYGHFLYGHFLYVHFLYSSKFIRYKLYTGAPNLMAQSFVWLLSSL